MDGSTALSIYREEKARALQERRISHAQLMAEAKEAFAKMLADAQLARKGGRPKSNPNAPNASAAKPKPALRWLPEKLVRDLPGLLVESASHSVRSRLCSDASEAQRDRCIFRSDGQCTN